MKKLFALCFIAIFSFKATAQDAEAYQKYMQESIALYDSVKTWPTIKKLPIASIVYLLLPARNGFPYTTPDLPISI